MNKCPKHLIEELAKDGALLRLTCRRPEEHESVEKLVEIIAKVYGIFALRENFDIEW